MMISNRTHCPDDEGLVELELLAAYAEATEQWDILDQIRLEMDEATDYCGRQIDRNGSISPDA